ncbi:translesion error-prone DNA polymerase V subunit UmuC [Thorsellia kenyensis]|uniref:Translesion error-prone DNA polymerase V subunit UmuC n=1 Tax=Thorsellia kenyensis TaxID=1549888 RepID=A0ABV6CGD6_9GAMM
MGNTCFALVDCNNFYASCEKLFRPDLKYKPVVVLSNNDGCVIARSAEAKALGIKMGVPFFEIKPLVLAHQITLFSSNYALYADMSHRVMQTLEEISAEVEVYSIDEAFIDLSGVKQNFELLSYGQSIQKKIKQEVGLSIGVGIGPTKTLAKLANYAAKAYPKTGGVVDLTDRQRQIKLMKITPVEEVWGVGRQLGKRLAELNIKTAFALACIPTFEIRKRFSVVLERTVRELNGESCLRIESIIPTKKQIVCSRSFGSSVTSLDSLEQAIASHAARAGHKLRQEKQKAKYLSIFITTSRFNPKHPYYNRSQGIQFLHPTDDSRQLIQAAKHGLKSIFRANYFYAKAGVMLTDFTPNHQYQYDLFNTIDTWRNEKLMKTIDEINLKTRHTLFFASEGINEPWQMKRRFLSPQYTTQWNDLLVVKG